MKTLDVSRRIEFTASLVGDDEQDVNLDQEIKPIEKRIKKLEKVAVNVENEAWSFQANEAIHRQLSSMFFYYIDNVDHDNL